MMKELPIIEKTYELIRWYVPILNRLPRSHKFALGDRLTTGLYELLDGLIAQTEQNSMLCANPLLDEDGVRFISRFHKVVAFDLFLLFHQIVVEVFQESHLLLQGVWIRRQSVR